MKDQVAVVLVVLLGARVDAFSREFTLQREKQTQESGGGTEREASVPEWSTGATTRVDLHHMGTASQEVFSLDLVRQEGPWAGSRTHLMDDLNLGDYLAVVSDAKTNVPLFSRGFNSPFEGGSKWMVCLDSIRFPLPKQPVQLAIKKRNVDNVGFREIWSDVLDPNGPSVDRSPLTSKASVEVVLNSGRPSTKVDVAILGDGYSDGDKEKFRADAKQATEYLFSVSPFKESRDKFNLFSVFVASEDQGVTSPVDEVWRNSAFGVSYNARNVGRAMEVGKDRYLRETAAVVPYDFIIILTNSRRYGGHGSYQRSTIVPFRSSLSKYLVIHEFSHQLAGLDDEYYAESEFDNSGKSTDVPKIEPWRPNVTACKERDKLKWRHLVQAGTPVPTPWARSSFEKLDREMLAQYFSLEKRKGKEAEIEQLAGELIPKTRAVLATDQYVGKVGAFEGAGGEPHGLYRAEIDCIMFTVNHDRFCAVCREAISKAIAAHTR